MYLAVAIVVMGIVMNYIYLPVFHDLKLTSTYQVCFFIFCFKEKTLKKQN